MKKRIVSMLMVGTMLATMFAGCGSSAGEGSSGSTSNGGSSAAGTETKTAEAEGDPVKIVMESLYFDATPTDLEAVEAAINEITIPAINVEVELYPLPFMEAASKVGLMISGQEQIDLVVNAARTDYLALVNKNMLLPLDELYEQYGADIKANAEDVIPGGYVGDELYGIPSIEKYGRTFGLIVKKEVTDAIGWTKFDDLTLEDMSDFLAQAKAAFPDKNIIHITGGGNNIADFEYFNQIDYVGADAACGGIMGIGKDSGSTLVNVFETDEYAEYCKTMREWFLAGYFNDDCATNTDPAAPAITSGTAVGYFLQTELDMVPGQSGANGCEMVALNTRPHSFVMSDINTATWSIPYTCENPEKAMELLNLMWSNEDLINLIYYGVEGLDYQLNDQGQVAYLDGQNAQTCGYRQWFGLYGNTQMRLTADTLPVDYHEQLMAFNTDVNDDNTSQFMGYSFNPDEMKSQYSAVNDVIKTYRTALECGAVDPEVELPKFIEALKTAGIDEIIAQNQSELDAWIAAQQ